MIYYLALTAWTFLRYRCKAVILTPTFVAGPFLKDSLFIWLSWLFRVRAIGWFHMDFSTMDYTAKGRLFQWYVRATLRRLNQLVCVSPSLISRMPSFMQDRPMTAIPNGVPAISSGERPKKTDAASPIRVLYLSNFLEAKGWKTLLSAAEILCKTETNVEFDFYGAASADYDEKAILKIFENSHYPDRIHYRGYCEGNEKRNAYQRADIFCLPSWNEAFPLTVLEAMSAGLPIVATRVGGVPDAVDEIQGGRLVEPKNITQLVNALSDLIANSSIRDKMTRFNHHRYTERYTVEAFRNRWRIHLTNSILQSEYRL